ncbi:hypothetical protein SCB71_05405 [Herbiconiux sp. KACC 21604]|uniref:hypothetical protein n=1 Tax=unclassified Herbiconiux TaxID=2618217 RepID=UPI001490ED2A|nr:hypothetical protein [Herbiconiux sp. SALV-R1]QJU52776.1 hypothetical protein HL652_03385 [Herbiconiux sp. SALV-R1]WPO87682.1 hypothetical protein SCB71_05405 [Herbiconiux sp. KACC 21604]
MVRIGRHPALGAIPLIAGVSVFAGFALAVPLSGFYGWLGAGAWSYALAFITLLLVLGGGIALGLGLAYGTVAWDPQRRIARLRGREVPLDSITELWRSMSDSGTATYLSYRFVSTKGPSVRVLVAGRPMRGLDADGLTALREFVAALPTGPDAERIEADAARAVDETGLTERQRAAAVTITTGGGKSRVSPATLLVELAGFVEAKNGTTASGRPSAVASPERAKPSAPADSISSDEAARIQADWAEADAAAATQLTVEVSTIQRLRRIAFWVTVLPVVVAAVAIVVAVIAETAGGGSIGSDLNDSIAVCVIGGMVFGVLFYLTWCASADADTRRRRRLADAAWNSLPASDRHLGIAMPFLAAWTQPALRLRRALAFVASVLGFIVVMVGIFLVVEPDGVPIIGAIAAIVVGAAMIAWSIFAFIAVHRAKRRDAERLVLLAGWRLLPPVVREP